MAKSDYDPKPVLAEDDTDSAGETEKLDALEKALKELKEARKGGASVTAAELAQLSAMKTTLSTLMDQVSDMSARLTAKAAKIKKPVFVYRFVDKSDKEGFVPDGKDAEIEARKRSKDGTVWYGYAYKKGDKFTGFVAIPTT